MVGAAALSVSAAVFVAGDAAARNLKNGMHSDHS